MPLQTQYPHAVGAPWLSGTNAPVLLGIKTSTALCACAVVALAYWLGASWLATRSIGIPLGAWAVFGAVGAARLWETRREQVSAVLTMPVDHWGTHAVGGFRAAIGRAVHPDGWLTDSASAARELLTRPMSIRTVDRARRTSRVPSTGLVRIGVATSIDELALASHSLAEVASGVRAEWKSIEPGRDPASDCARLGLDALIARDEADQVIVFAPDHPARPAAWRDWGRRLPLGYATVFPIRIDPARINLGAVNLDARCARLVVRVAEAAAVLSRCEARLSVTGRIRGHSCLPGFLKNDGPMAQCMKRLGAALTEWSGPEDGTLELRRPAARAAQAWLTTWEGEMDPEFRLRAVLACDAVLGDEPESTLRVGAARFAAYADEEGMRQVASAFARLKRMPREQTTDPLGFVLAEIELGSPGALTTGRIAAGLGMLWAVAGEESLHYLSDDLMEDLRYAARFIGQDQDLLMIKEVIARLERMRMEGTDRKSANAA